MKDLLQPIKSVGTAVKSQTKAQDKTSDARRELVLALWDNEINLVDKTQAAEFKLQVSKAYPKGTGKDADEMQKKQVQAIRQVSSTYKKGGRDVSPHNFDSYAEYRKEVYGEKTKSKMETIQGWLDNDKIEDVTIDALLALVNEYKAIKLAA